MKTQHTSGPWFDHASPLHPFEVTEQSGIVLAQTFPRSATRQAAIDEAEANARLISSAPMMLKALEVAERALDGMPVPDGCAGNDECNCQWCCALRSVRAAIAKATH